MSGKRNRLGARFVGRMGSTHYKNNIVKSDLPKFTFPDNLYANASGSQQGMMRGFENIINTSPKINLQQRHFNKGTLRITKPGYYVLSENIVFNPPTLFPNQQQIDSGLYPIGTDGPYHLGFFGAIAVETSNVVIDLNGRTITQSTEHNLLQRFFAVVELANSPFIPGQGPHSFIDTFGWKPASNTLIMNGGLLNSSHHGVHGNENANVMVYNTTITNYEVGGVALNGATGSIVSNNVMKGNNTTIKILSSFPQSIFALRALEQKGEQTSTVYTALKSDVELATTQILNNQPQTTYFQNITGKYDGNMYGIVLNVKGVVINKFIEERTEAMTGNQDILIMNNSMRDVDTHPVEIVALKASDVGEGAYGGKRMVGPFGDVFDIEKIMDDDKKYVGNSLSNAQLYLAEKYPGLGSINITQEVIDWSKSDPKDLLSPTLEFLPEGDSMGHFMKGNIGIFVSAGIDIKLLNNVLTNVITSGDDVGNSPLFTEAQRYYHGANSYGILQTASTNVTGVLSNTITNVVTEQPTKAEAVNTKEIN